MALATGEYRHKYYNTPAASRLLIESFNGKPQASLPDVAYACGSPLNENAQYTTKSTPAASAVPLTEEHLH